MIFLSGRMALILLVLLITLGGCAHRSAFNGNTENIYNTFRSAYGNCNATGIRAKASLYYTSKGSGHRTTMSLWGDYASPAETGCTRWHWGLHRPYPRG